MMNKRKTVLIAVAVGTGILAVMDRIRLHSKVEDLEERTKDIGRCHNDFCLMQERYNRSTNEQITSIQEEDVYKRQDLMVLDPPRAGCDKALLDAIGHVVPKRIVYVSCCLLYTSSKRNFDILFRLV